MLLFDLAVVVWALLPAYFPNNVAVLFGGGAPIDGGRMWRGSRLLGDGKTWRGFLIGVGWGVALGVALNNINTQLLGTAYPVFSHTIAFTLAFGAMSGDLVGSFIKRRFNYDRGAPLPIDQFDFLAGALLLTVVIVPFWLTTLPTDALILIIVVTPLAHLGLNKLAFALGLKDVPW